MVSVSEEGEKFFSEVIADKIPNKIPRTTLKEYVRISHGN